MGRFLTRRIRLGDRAKETHMAEELPVFGGRDSGVMNSRVDRVLEGSTPDRRLASE